MFKSTYIKKSCSFMFIWNTVMVVLTCYTGYAFLVIYDTTGSSMDWRKEQIGMIAKFTPGCQIMTNHSGRSSQRPVGRVLGLGRNRQTVLSSQNRADFVALELELGYTKNWKTTEPKRKRKIEPWCLPITIMGILVLLLIFLPFINTDKPDVSKQRIAQSCDKNCRLILVESIPRHLKYPKHAPVFPSIFSTWMDLIQSAKSSIDIASFYWDLRLNDSISVQKSPQHDGERIFKELAKAGLQRKIKIRIVQSEPDKVRFPDKDTCALSAMGAAEVRSLNFKYMLGSGVLHTKFWIIDGGQSFWIGSANMDWRSLTEVKELGVTGINCSCLGEDLLKVFAAYWYLGASNTTKIPDKWPSSYSTNFNKSNPFLVPYNDAQTSYPVFIASSPPAFCSTGRTTDLDALTSVMKAAHKFVYIAVMDYTPVLQDQHGKSYWPAIDDAIRSSAFDKGTTVRLLVSKWNHTNPAMIYHLRSLLALNGVMRGKIEIKWFKVPAFTPVEEKIPFARVNHNKFMVTESYAYIGTSNWEGDYFTTTAGVSIIISDNSTTSPNNITYSRRFSANQVNSNPTIRDQLESVFLRDWNSKYSSDLESAL